MSFVMQYLILRAVILETHKEIQTPSSFALPYSELHALWLLHKIPKIGIVFDRAQWKTCCVLNNMGLVEMRHGQSWFIAVTKSGALFLHDLKMQMIKAACTVLLAVVSAFLGFALGQGEYTDANRNPTANATTTSVNVSTEIFAERRASIVAM